MKPKRFIVGVDSSAESRRASIEAIELAKLVEAKVTLLHAVHTQFGDLDSFAHDIASLMEEEAKHANEALKELSNGFVKQGATVSYYTKHGHPEEVLSDAAVDEHADLCIVGSHGYTGLERFLMGSVAERVVRTCPTNVLVSRRDVDRREGYDRILVAVDFTDLSEQALAQALEFANPGATVDLVHCWQLPATGAFHYTPVVVQERFVAPVRLAIREDVNKQAEALLEKYRRGGVELHFEAEEGPTVHTLLERLEDPGGYDLVAMGSHGRRGVRRFILGSVAEKVMRFAKCSVLIAHAKQP